MAAGKKAGDEHARKSAVIISALGVKRRSMVVGVVDTLVAMLRDMLAGTGDRDRFVDLAERGERAALVQSARLGVAAYRKTAGLLGVRPDPVPLPALPDPYDWGDVYDEAMRRLDEAVPDEDGALIILEDDEPEEAPETVSEALDDIGRDLADRLDERARRVQDEIRDKTYGSLSSRQVIGYRRVVHPELSKGGSCGLCLVASTRMYSRPDLKPVHDRCHCEVLPVTREHDPGDSLNRIDLGDLYDAAGDRNRAAPLKRVRVNAAGQIVAKVGDVDKSFSARTQQEIFDEIKRVRKQRPSAERTATLRRLRDRLRTAPSAA